MDFYTGQIYAQTDLISKRDIRHKNTARTLCNYEGKN